MVKWVERNQTLLWLISALIGATAWAFTTFATTSYVDKQDQNTMQVLTEVRNDVKDIHRYLLEHGAQREKRSGNGKTF